MADARLVRIEAAAPKPLPVKEGRAAYEQISGTFFGELDPKDIHNRIITDLDKAPRNARGMVEYEASFAMARPVDPAMASGALFYDVPNRGNATPFEAHEDGHILLVSGWQADLPPGPGVQWLKAPVAAGITGPVLVRFVKVAAGSKSMALGNGLGRNVNRPQPVSLDTTKAQLMMSRRGLPDLRIAPTDWAFADCTTASFPGTPDPTKICLKNGFNADAAYTLSYVGKDPLVLGIGFAATRDLIAHFKAGKAHIAGSPIRWTIGVGNSQSGNYLRSFTHLGFNSGEDGARIFDGINPNIAARQIVLNLRFGFPGGAADAFAPGSEGTLWWGRYADKARGRKAASLLDRCNKDRTCPKIIETFGSAEFWGLRASPGLVGTDAKSDIPLPANVRRYYFPSITHGGAFRGGFSLVGEAGYPGQSCQLSGNPNPSKDQMRVARKALVDWVKLDKAPPPSSYPTLAKGDLVEPTAKAMGWPAIPGAPVPDGHINPFTNYDFGPGFIASDVSGHMAHEIPRERGALPQRIPRVNADGNEISGIASVHLQVPLGTYTGWNVEAQGYEKDRNCGFAGGFIPFARTKAERDAKGDPRLSLEERYGNREQFLAMVTVAVLNQEAAGWLLPEDGARIIKEAEDSAVLH